MGEAEVTYESFYGLKENPFGVTPDPRFFFSGKSHRDALAYLRYTLGEHKGFAVVTGEVGVGKTTVVKTFVQSLEHGVDTAVVLNPRLSFKQLLSTVVSEFGLSVKGKSKAELLIDLRRFLLDSRRRDRNVILILDEAQNLPAASLEEIRMLSNLESDDRKLLQIAFVGQPELSELLALRELRQLRQRIPGICTIAPLSRPEVDDYVRTRLEKAGGDGSPRFADEAFAEVFKHSDGIPRLVNFICDRTLLLGFVEEKKQVDAGLVIAAARDLEVGQSEEEESLGKAAM
ncbi:MAG: AAA family ATPase [Candidatus Eiseniibacteriota bacterium]|nr:MAG: AAA family ATPase [Candidatus Eisenbacteria bacterium]